MQGDNIDSVEQSEIRVTVGQDFEACSIELFLSDVSICPTCHMNKRMVLEGSFLFEHL